MTEFEEAKEMKMEFFVVAVAGGRMSVFWAMMLTLKRMRKEGPTEDGG